MPACWRERWRWGEVVFLTWVGGGVEGLVEGDGGCRGGVYAVWEAIAWVLRLKRSVDGGLGRGRDVGL